MTFFKLTIFLFACLVNLNLLQAQVHEHEHCHSRNEVSFSGGVIYAFNHQEWGFGTHLHYFRSLSRESNWSLGGGFEYARAGENHFSIGAGVQYSILDRFEIALIPGITFFEEEASSGYTSKFSLHAEIVYDLFHWDKFHLGPTIDYSWDLGDSHCMLGVHAAYSF